MQEKPKFKVSQVVALDSEDGAETGYFRIRAKSFAGAFYTRWMYLEEINRTTRVWWQESCLRALNIKEERLAEIFKKKRT